MSAPAIDEADDDGITVIVPERKTIFSGCSGCVMVGLVERRR